MSDGAVFVDAPQIEARGHVSQFWSDDDRLSFVACSCGFEYDAFDCLDVLDQWREHLP